MLLLSVCNTLRQGSDTPQNRQKAKEYSAQPILEDFPRIKPHSTSGLFDEKMAIKQQDTFDRLVIGLAGNADNDSLD